MCSKLAKNSCCFLISSASCCINFACMKYLNSISDTYLERDKELIQLFRKAKMMVDYPTTMVKICQFVSTMPASCYYIADSTAYRYVSKRLKGIMPKFGKHQQKKKSLCESFYEEFLIARKKEEYKGLSNCRLVDIVLTHPAPNLGISPRYIQMKISRYYHGRSITDR